MEKTTLLSEEKIVSRIYFIRGKKVMLDRDLAAMYGVVTGHLNRAVKRNVRRFPDDFMFQLTPGEFEILECQIGIPNNLDKKTKRGGAWTLPYVFTEQGVAMLSSVLNSDTAIEVNIQIIRVFTRMREMLLSHKDVLLKIETLEKKVLEQNADVGRHDAEIEKIFEVLKGLMQPQTTPMKKVGYKRKGEQE
jgi:hypothetical protein